MILALDTSGVELLVALVDDRGLVEGRASPGPRHQDRIMELISEVTGGDLATVEGLAVARGPGSHTGLRVGLSTAAGVAFSRRLPIHPLSSLGVAAQRVPDGVERILAVVGAGRGRVHVQPFTANGRSRAPVGDRRLEPLSGFDIAGWLVAAEPDIAALLAPPAPPPGRTGLDALTAAVLEAVGGGARVNYDQLTGDYGDF